MCLYDILLWCCLARWLHTSALPHCYGIVTPASYTSLEGACAATACRDKLARVRDKQLGVVANVLFYSPEHVLRSQVSTKLTPAMPEIN